MKTGKEIMNPIFMAFVCITFSASFCFCKETKTYLNSGKTFQGPIVYKDSVSGTLFIVETDGRHIDAINKAGKLIWSKDPFLENNLKPYRFENPQIVYIGSPPEWSIREENKNNKFIGINYNSTQFGIINIQTGEFKFLGQD